MSSVQQPVQGVPTSPVVEPTNSWGSNVVEPQMSSVQQPVIPTPVGPSSQSSNQVNFSSNQELSTRGVTDYNDVNNMFVTGNHN